MHTGKNYAMLRKPELPTVTIATTDAGKRETQVPIMGALEDQHCTWKKIYTAQIILLHHSANSSHLKIHQLQPILRNIPCSIHRWI